MNSNKLFYMALLLILIQHTLNAQSLNQLAGDWQFKTYCPDGSNLDWPFRFEIQGSELKLIELTYSGGFSKEIKLDKYSFANGRLKFIYSEYLSGLGTMTTAYDMKIENGNVMNGTYEWDENILSVPTHLISIDFPPRRCDCKFMRRH